MFNNELFFNFLRKKKADWSGKPRAKLSQREVDEANAIISPTQPAVAPLVANPSDGLTSKKQPLTALVGSVAATLLLTVVPQFEGTEYKAYQDIAGIWTICQGDTKDVHAGLIETPEGCRKRLEIQLSTHAKGMLLCTPALKQEGLDYVRAAGTSLTYNIGIGAYCKSSIDKNWDVGQWMKGCERFIAWNKARVRGQLVPVRGLTIRRQQEIQICGTNLVQGWTPANLKQRMKAIK